jgi:hypothetical protein
MVILLSSVKYISLTLQNQMMSDTFSKYNNDIIIIVECKIIYEKVST